MSGSGTEMMLLSSVTAPVRAKIWPLVTVAPVVRVSLTFAMRVPLNCEVVPRVAELPTC